MEKKFLILVAFALAMVCVSCSDDDDDSSLNVSSTDGDNTDNNSSVSSASGTINGHDYVDLGLSVKWATCNVDASSPSRVGQYYAWGETISHVKFTKENSVTYGKEMGCIAGDSTYDVARAKWGGTWRLPHNSECDDLIYKCEREIIILDGEIGYKFTGPNGNSIFLCVYRYNLITKILDGGYWSAEPAVFDKENENAWALHFSVSGGVGYGNYPRYEGLQIRPVCD